MNSEALIQNIGLVTSVILPLFNIPLVVRMIRRRSSSDLSLFWAFGVFLCLIGMLPAAWQSGNLVFRVFSVANLSLFSGVVFATIYYRVHKN